MDTKQTPFTNIDDYIAAFPPEVQQKLTALRVVIRSAAPNATEKISYQMPTFFLYGNLVHFAAYAGHIGFYPAPSGIAAFQSQLTTYKSSKGAVQFPLDQPLPMDLIAEIVRFRVAENLKKAGLKAVQGFLSTLGAPARRALVNEGITTLEALAQFSEFEILALHGVGPSSIPKLRTALQAKGLTFRASAS